MRRGAAALTTQPDGEQALLEVGTDAGVLVLTLNRPGSRNALSPGLVEELDAALTRFSEDDGLRAAVITGRGTAFCAGLDLKAYSAATADRRAPAALIDRVGRLAKPVIGAVNGPAFTGGFELALGCDWLIGSPAALFGDTHVSVGAFPGGGMTARLGHVVGVRTAKAMSLAGLRLDAEAALRAGLLSEIVEADLLVERAVEMARSVAAANQDLVGAVRALHDDNVDRSVPEALAAEKAALEQWRAQGGRRGWSG